MEASMSAKWTLASPGGCCRKRCHLDHFLWQSRWTWTYGRTWKMGRVWKSSSFLASQARGISSDTWPVELATFLVSIVVVVASCVGTLVSYAFIISSILRIQSAHGRKKAFSTCSAHLGVVTIWYGSTVFLYVKPSAHNSLERNKLVNTFNTVITPLLNPFIYTLRNREVKEALGRAFQRK